MSGLARLPLLGLAVASRLAFGAAAPLICPAGAPIGNVDLRVQQARGGNPLPLKTINRLGEGDSILYRPLLRSNENRKGEVAIVLVPAIHPANEDYLTVLTPKRADKPAEWKVPSKSAVAAFVYGPAGLNAAKVKRFLSKDDALIEQLADYAEKTAQTEALIQALSSDTGTGETVNAAFQGFASQYGFASQLDRTQNPNQQMMLAFRALNPAVANYDPISPQPSQRISQTASLATSVAALFFGSPVGLAAGGTAMLMEMRSVVFPNTVFRSSFAQPIAEDGLGLCGRRDAVPAHTKVAYLWATRVPNMGPPHVALQKSLTLPMGMKAPLPVDVPIETDWKNLDRARKWTLEPLTTGHKSIAVPVRQEAEPKALEIDLTKTTVPPGKYRLVADWDWDPFVVSGEVNVASLGSFEKVRLGSDSQDRLITKSGRVVVTLEGGDFQFVTKAELAKPGDKFFTLVPVPFAMPEGFRLGSQTKLDVQVNTGDLEAGDYRLILTQPDGKPHPVPLALLPAPPRIDNLPVLVNHGEADREVTLRGEHLERVGSLKAPGLHVTLDAAKPDGSERKATLHFDSDVAAGHDFAVQEYVENRREPLLLPAAIRVIGPRPRITDAKLSLPPGLKVLLNPGELPASYSLSALLHVSGLEKKGAVVLQCRGDNQTRQVLTFERFAPNELFVTFNSGDFPNNCDLLATPEASAEAADNVNETNAYALGRIVRMPKIELFKGNGLQVGDAPGDEGHYTLYGQDLELIDRVGWDAEHPSPVVELPSTMPEQGKKQMLPISLPSGGAAASLYIWLRGETKGRSTAIYLAGTTE